MWCSGKFYPPILLSSLGADLAVDYKAVPVFSEPVLEFTHGKGVDLIFDPIMSGPHFNEVSVS
jgi:NADPH:quinone reductase-like Zn-dependent oxidoreductase